MKPWTLSTSSFPAPDAPAASKVRRMVSFSSNFQRWSSQPAAASGRTAMVRISALLIVPPPSCAAPSRRAAVPFHPSACPGKSMAELWEGWNPEEHPEVMDLIPRLAAALLADDDKLLADAGASTA